MDKQDTIILCFMYGIVLLFLILYFVKALKQKKYMPVHNGIISFFMLYYLIIPVLVFINIDKLNVMELRAGKYCSYTFQRFIINGGWRNYLYSIFMISTAIASFIFFYQNKTKTNKKIKYCFNRVKTYSLVKWMMYVTFFIGMLSLILFFSSLGGIKNALSYAERMRNMSNSLVEEIGKMALLKITARFITVVPILVLYLLDEDNHNNITYKIILVTSLIASTLFYLYNAGRTPIILFLLCFIYLLLYNKTNKVWLVIIITGVIALPLLDVLDQLFVFLNSGSFNMKQSNYLYYLYQFSPTYKNTLMLLDLNKTFGLRFGKDFVLAFLDLLPGLNFEPSYASLSLFVRGDNWKLLGGIPTDLIMFSHMQLSFLGVIICSGILGIIAQIIDYKLSFFKNERMKYFFGGVLTIYFFSMLSSADIASIIRGQLILLSLVFIIFKSSKKEKIK